MRTAIKKTDMDDLTILIGPGPRWHTAGDGVLDLNGEDPTVIHATPSS